MLCRPHCFTLLSRSGPAKHEMRMPSYKFLSDRKFHYKTNKNVWLLCIWESFFNARIEFQLNREKCAQIGWFTGSIHPSPTAWFARTHRTIESGPFFNDTLLFNQRLYLWWFFFLPERALFCLLPMMAGVSPWTITRCEIAALFLINRCRSWLSASHGQGAKMQRKSGSNSPLALACYS